MTTITVTSRKGGVGKSTTAVGLAIAAATRSPRYAGRPVVLVDTDRRAASAEWLSDQPVPGVEVIEAPTERLLERFGAAEIDPEALVVIDTPNATDNPGLVAIGLRIADLAVIPARVGGLELSALRETIEEVIAAGKPFGVALTATIANSTSLAVTTEQLERFEISVLGHVPHRVAIQDAGLSPFPLTSLLAYEAILERALCSIGELVR